MSDRSKILAEVLAELGQFKNCIMDEYKPLREKYGLTPPNVKLLTDVRERPVTLRDLAEKYHITPGAVTQFVDTLVGKGLVVRSEDPDDRRITFISVPPEASDQVEDIIAAHKEAVGKLFSSLSDEKLEELRNLLQICTQNRKKEKK